MTNENEVAVAILPYGVKFGLAPSSFPLNDLHWPLGQPARLLGKLLSDLSPNDHLIIYPRGVEHIRPSFGTFAKISIMVVEPRAVHGRHMNLLRWSYRRFHRVLAADQNLLQSIPNGIFLPFGTTWVDDLTALDVSKSDNISLIASSKNDLLGHKLRHEVVDWARQNQVSVDVMGGGYRPFEKKSDGLAAYRFSVIIENVREANYFTEKLLDAVLCETVPIYWGCPNIDQFLATEGMILCNSKSAIQEAMLSATQQLFEEKLPALRNIKEQAVFWANLESRAAQAVRMN